MFTSFEAYATHDDRRMFEWIDGEVELLPELSAEQLRLRDALLAEIGGFAEANGIGLLIAAPFPLRMPEEMRRGREPDLLFVPNVFAETVQDTYVNSHGVTLVIEISDHRTRAFDTGVKRDEYQTAGLPEYWIVDADTRTTLCLVLRDGRYEPATADGDGLYRPRALRGLAIDLAALWR